MNHSKDKWRGQRKSEQQKGRKVSKATIQHSMQYQGSLLPGTQGECRRNLECLQRKYMVLKVESATAEQSTVQKEVL